MLDVRVSVQTRQLVDRLPPGRTRLSAPRLRIAYGLAALSRAERSRIARELHAAGLDVAGDAYGVIVSKPRNFQPGGLRLRSGDLHQGGSSPLTTAQPSLAAAAGGSSSVAARRHPKFSAGLALVGVLAAAAAAAAAAAVGFGGADNGHSSAGVASAPVRTAWVIDRALQAASRDDYALALSEAPLGPQRQLVQVRVARRYGVRSTRALARGDLADARVLLSAAHALPDVVEVQRASRSLARRERAVGATHQPQ